MIILKVEKPRHFRPTIGIRALVGYFRLDMRGRPTPLVCHINSAGAWVKKYFGTGELLSLVQPTMTMNK